MQGIIYDCEIIKCIPNGARFSDYQYCNGWEDFKNMGISVIGIIDLESGKTQAFIHNDAYQDSFDLKDGYRYLTEFLSFLMFEHQGKIVGFNSHQFDDNLVKANHIHINSDIDLLKEIRIAAYGSSSWKAQPAGFKYSLDAIARANGLEKTGSGALAPQLWQQGKFGDVIDYCLNDVKITREIFLKFEKAELIDPNTGNKLGLAKGKKSEPDVDDIQF